MYFLVCLLTLVQTNHSMKKIRAHHLQLWQFENLSGEPSIKHFVTDRNSNSQQKEFTLSYSSSPDREEIVQNRQSLAGAMGISPNRLFFPSQVHDTRIVHVTPDTKTEELLETDALITTEKEICIAVMSADCVPILLYDKRNQVIAAVHSGWRGTVAKILEKTLHTLHAQFDTKGQDLVAGIGPSVCQESYEVGEEVVQAVDEAFGKKYELVTPQSNGKARFDLWKANELQLLDFGVSPSQIELSHLCTVKNNHHFYSARKGDRGRFGAGIMMI